jgi:hypothetical protein
MPSGVFGLQPRTVTIIFGKALTETSVAASFNATFLSSNQSNGKGLIEKLWMVLMSVILS